MLAFGFGFLPEENAFDGDDAGSRVVNLVTDRGLRVAGTANSPSHVRQLSFDPGHVTEDLLREAKAISRELSHEDVTSEVDTMTVQIADLEEPAGAQWGRQVAMAFAEATVNGAAWASSPSGFIETAQMVNPQVREELLSTYVPRELAGRSDLEVLRMLAEAEKSVLLEGPPGTGKTVAAMKALQGLRPVVVQCSESTTVADLMGVYQPVERSSQFTWLDGPVVTAMAKGRPLLLDDCHALHPGVQVALHPICDSRRSVDVIDRPGQQHIDAAPGFAVILTSNPDEGAGITRALRNRMAAIVNVPTDFAIARMLRVPSLLVDLAVELQRRADDDGAHGLGHWVPSMRELLEVRDLTNSLDVNFAAHALVSKCSNDEDRDFAVQWLRRYVGDEFAEYGVLTSGSTYESASTFES